MPLPFDKYDKYERFGLPRDRRAVWIRPGRDLDEFELIAHESMERAARFNRERLVPLAAAIRAAGGRAHARVSHKFNDGGGTIPPWWLYRANKDGVSWNWCKQEPELKLHPELGTAYYLVSQANDLAWARAGILLRTFTGKLDQWACLHKPKRVHMTQRLKLNGRSYWTTSVRNEHGVLYWKLLNERGDRCRTISPSLRIPQR